MSTSIRDKLVNGSSTNFIEHHLHLLSFGSKVMVSISPELLSAVMLEVSWEPKSAATVSCNIPSLTGDNYKLFQHI
jgi:hypothetical protein